MVLRLGCVLGSKTVHVLTCVAIDMFYLVLVGEAVGPCLGSGIVVLDPRELPTIKPVKYTGKNQGQAYTENISPYDN